MSFDTLGSVSLWKEKVRDNFVPTMWAVSLMLKMLELTE